MTAFGFSITSLTLTGTGVSNAELHFTDGLNVISGPSNTGKTFIVQCIDFALGAGSEPKSIQEAAAYDTVHLGLRFHESGNESMLQRSLRGNQVLLQIEGKEDRVLALKHNPKSEETLSHYLLSLSGLAGKIVRTNRKGKTRNLSFRDLAHLVVVDEDSMINENSPVHTVQVVKKTLESNVFRLLLTGADDSSVVESADCRLVKSRNEDNIEVMEQLRTAVELLERRASLQEMITSLEKPSATEPENSPSAAVCTTEAEAFSKEAEDVLRSWRYPDIGRVTFSETTQDLVISGRERSSHVRAITHAAFNVALLNYCRSRSMPHPGFVVLDSPLVVYREPYSYKDGVSEQLNNAFYESLAAYEGTQILVLENEDPPSGLETSANIIKFTGTDRGRRGFIPLSNDTGVGEEGA